MTSTINDERSPGSGGPGLADPAAADAIIAGLHAAFREMRCIGSQRMLERGLSATQYYTLSMLERHGQMTMSRLAEMLDVSLSNATGLVDRMEERRLVERVRVPDDRRVVLVRIADHGQDLLAEVEILRDDLVVRVLGELDARQLARAARTLDDVRAALGRVREHEPSFFEHRHRATA